MKAWAKLLITLSVALNIGVLGGGLYRVLAQGESGAGQSDDGQGRLGRGPQWRPGMEPGDWPGRRAARLRQHLQLSHEQGTRLQAELGHLQPHVHATGRELMEARERFGQLLLDEPPLADAVRAQQAKISKLQSHMDSLVAEVLLREASILRPEQRRLHGPHWPGGGLHHERRGGRGHHGMRR